MTPLKKIAVALLFLSTITAGAVLGCGGGGGGGTIASSCDHVCQCAVDGMFITSAEKAACVSDCTTSATAEMPTQECIDCIGDSTCTNVLSGMGCETECPDVSDAGAHKRSPFGR